MKTASTISSGELLATKKDVAEADAEFNRCIDRLRRVIHDSGATLATRKKLLDELQLHSHLMRRTIDNVKRIAREG